jgi:hypothetical protein
MLNPVGFLEDFRFSQQVASLPPAYLLVVAEIISSTLKMEAICSSETSVATQQTTRRHIPEADTLQLVLYFGIVSNMSFVFIPFNIS